MKNAAMRAAAHDLVFGHVCEACGLEFPADSYGKAIFACACTRAAKWERESAQIAAFRAKHHGTEAQKTAEIASGLALYRSALRTGAVRRPTPSYDQLRAEAANAYGEQSTWRKPTSIRGTDGRQEPI